MRGCRDWGLGSLGFWCRLLHSEASLKRLRKPDLEKKLAEFPALPEHVVPSKLRKEQLVAEILKLQQGDRSNRKISTMFGAK